MSAQPHTITPVISLADHVLEKKLSRLMELKTLASEYNKLKKELKPLFEGEDKIQVGSFTITGQYKDRKAYQVPSTRYWDWQVK